MAEPALKHRKSAFRALRMSVARGPTMAELRGRLKRALREEEGVDHGPLSRAERDELLAKQFGL